jgi:NAD(P)-dependent dehydrogenase (short-subunit alcohol dehydrogenase family)
MPDHSGGEDFSSGLAGRRIVVTGAAGGIGSAVADTLDRHRAIVVRTDLAGESIDFPCNITDRDSVHRLFEAATADGPLHGLVHCSAKCGVAGPFHAVDELEWRAYIEVNLTGSFHVCQEAARRMISAGQGGRIVVIGSVNALSAEGANSPYVASKGGVRMLVKSMAVDLARYGIAANLVHPGAIAVARNAHVMTTQPFGELMHELVPEGRVGKPEDVARVAAFLVDPATYYINGAELAVDGGLTAQLLSRKSWPEVSESKNSGIPK